jgi:hypothetical protein
MVRGTLLASVLLLVGCATGARPGPGVLDGGPRDASPPRDAPLALDGGATDAPLPPLDGGEATDAPPGSDGGADGGTDAGFDAGFDSGPPPGCTSAAMCSDGLACNGIERCTAGTCGPGVAVACDDGIACTVDTCTEPAGTCAFTPSSTLCPMGMTCDPARGCTSMCAESPCRLVAPQCGCPGAQACVVDSTGARFCASAGTASTGQACTGVAGCRAGDLCINIHPSGTTNVCSHFCASDTGCAGGLCIVTLNDGAGGTLPGVTLCTHVCDPVTPSGCPAGSFCGIFQETAGAMRLLTDCGAPAGVGGQGATCTDDTDCQNGFGCVGGACLHWCRYPAGTGCAIGYTCYPFMTPVIIRGVQYGVCDLP